MNDTEKRYANYFSMTVKELREIAKRMGIKGQFLAARKADLVNYILDMIDYDHSVALEMNEAFKPAEVTYTVEGGVTFTGTMAQFLIDHEKRVKRYNPLLKRDKTGKVILTAKQFRRIAKKDRKQFYATVS